MFWKLYEVGGVFRGKGILNCVVLELDKPLGLIV